MTAAGAIFSPGEVLIRKGVIAEVGTQVTHPDDAQLYAFADATITPGIIDTHTHLGLYAAPHFIGHDDGNESSSPVTPEVRAEDGFWPQDPQLRLALAGGVTTMQVLPGSANLIAGRTFTIKNYPNARSAEDARFRAAPYGLKTACGENPKRVHGDDGGPKTRMGTMARFRSAFEDARAYALEWKTYLGKRRRSDEGDAPDAPPKRDLGLETLAAAMRGDILVHTHCYRADDMLAMLALAEEYGFRIRSFHHAVEAYKIADRLREHGSSVSMWADWWGFKVEAFDGIRENAAIVSTMGARAIIHSDSAQGVQRLNQEAAKAMFAGRAAGLAISDDEALQWITAHPAWALGVDEQVGTLEPGKDADIVVWSGSPFSVYTHATMVFIEGALVYDRANPPPVSDFEVGLDVASR